MNTAPNTNAVVEVRPATMPEIIGHHVHNGAEVTVQSTVCVTRGLFSGIVSGWNKGMKRSNGNKKYFIDTNGNMIIKE